MLDGKKLWVAITAHNPLNRVDCLLSVIQQYLEYEMDVDIFIYVNNEAQEDVPALSEYLEPYGTQLNLNIVVAGPEYQGWALTWAHKTDLVLACMNYRYDYYIYQENDMLLTWDNFKYWVRWRPRLARLGLEPGFIRYENHDQGKIPFDNHYEYSLTSETPNVWSERGFTVPKVLVVDHEIKFFVQVANPYYGAMILDKFGAVKYVKSQSMDVRGSCLVVSYRNWPLADRSSMGLAFEDVPATHEHTRCIPVVEHNGRYEPHEAALICHNDTKYSVELSEKLPKLVTCKTMLKL